MITTKEFKMDFTKIPNDLLRDISLSAGAFRVYAYIASKPSDWGVNNKDIKTQLGIGSNRTVSNFLKELISSGWIERIKQPRENGKFSAGYDYIINKKPSYDIDRIRQKWNDDKMERRESGTHSKTKYTKTNSTNTNIGNKTKKKGSAQKESINSTSVKNAHTTKKEEKKKESPAAKKEKCTPDNPQQVIEYLLSENIPIELSTLEANKFFDHFESNGWRVGGKTPMKKWKASIRNWMRNAKKYHEQGKKTDNGRGINEKGGKLKVARQMILDNLKKIECES